MPKRTNKPKVVCSFEITSPMDIANELNEIWGSMNELTELCKLISERVDNVTKRIDAIVQWNGLTDEHKRREEKSAR